MANETIEIECPRCLGKGFVNDTDIKRLGRQLEWTPDLCGYCGGIGTVNEFMLKNKEVDDLYLTSDLPLAERQKYLSNDQEALTKADIHEINVRFTIDLIQDLHRNEKKNVDEITHILIHKYGLDEADDFKIKNWVTTIIQHTKSDS